VLNNFSINFEAGKTTALVGSSGSGKSTIVQLIERFYDPEQGSVLIDDLDIRTLNLTHLRREILGYVS
jgi:ATP-binding cassette subfamily B (MDR/TAP) protein 1